MKMIFVKPARAGLQVPFPTLSQPLDADGGYVPRDQFTLRRLDDGDVVEADAPAAAPVAPAGKAAKAVTVTAPTPDSAT